MDLAPKRLTKQSFKQFAGEHPSVLPLKSPDIWSAIVFLIQECDLKKSKNLCSVQSPIPPILLIYANAVLLQFKI